MISPTRMPHIMSARLSDIADGKQTQDVTGAAISSGGVRIAVQEPEWEIVREGLAEILDTRKPKANADGSEVKKDAAAATQEVFYNPIQQYNRDLSVLAIRVFSEDWEARRLEKEAGKRQRTQKEAEEAGKRHGTQKDQKRNSENENERDAPESKRRKFREALDDAAGEARIKGPEVRTKANFRVLDALSATGLRALRYAQEIPLVTMVVANDMSESAVDSIGRNVKHNGLYNKVFPIQGNAMQHMHNVASKFFKLPNGEMAPYHVIDLDPYGTASPFIDAAVQATADGGMLCVTCTDASVFASTGYLEKTWTQYGGLPIKGPQSHEGGLRLILHAISTSAARYSMAIEPLLSLSIDFYTRVFVRLRKSPAEIKFLASKTMVVYNCDSGCGAWKTQPLARTQAQENAKGAHWYKYSLAQAPTAGSKCEHCGYKTHLAGPMWAGAIQNPYFIQRILDMLPSLDRKVYGTLDRMEGMLTLARDETIIPESDVEAINKTLSSSKDQPTQDSSLPLRPLFPQGANGLSTSNFTAIPRLPPTFVDQSPFHICPSSLAKVLHCVSPSFDAFRGALYSLGYRATLVHTKPGSLRTDAPWSVIWEIMREWVRQKAPIKEGALTQRTAGWRIMQDARPSVAEEPKRLLLRKVRQELSALSYDGESLEEVKKDLESMLWRIDHVDKEYHHKEATAFMPNLSPNTPKSSKPNTKMSLTNLMNTPPPQPPSPPPAHPSSQPAPPPSLTKPPISTAITSTLDDNADEEKNGLDNLSKLHKLKITFDESLGRDPDRRKYVRYQLNPRANWGPMSRARPGYDTTKQGAFSSTSIVG